MAIGTDFTINVSGDIRHDGTSSNTYTVLELHRWLQSLADDAVYSGDDNLDITYENPSDRSTDRIITLLNNFNIDDDAAQKFYGGSITQDNGDTIYSGLQVLGSVNLGSTQIQIVQDNALVTNFWGTGINSSGSIITRMLIKSRVNGHDIDGKRIRVQSREYKDTYSFFDVELGEGVSVAAITTINDTQNNTDSTTVATYSDVTNVEGHQLIDINNGNGPQPYYSKWTYGSQPSEIRAIWEKAKYIQRRGTSETIHGINGELFLGITHSISFTSETGTLLEDEIIAWGTSFNYDGELGGPFTLGETLNFSTSKAVGQLIFLDDNGTTGDMVVAIEPGSGTVVDNDVIAGVTSLASCVVQGTPTATSAVGGTGLLLARDGVGSNLYIQLLTGVAPVNTLRVIGRNSDAFATAGTPIAKSVPNTFLGSYTGNLIGAYGIGIDADDFSNTDTVEDLVGVTQAPPINVEFSLTGLISNTEIRIYRNSDNAELSGTESSSATFSYNYIYATDIAVTVVVFHVDYLPIRLSIILGNSDQSIPVQQIFDRNYSNPA